MKNALFAAVLSAAALACLPARAQEDSLEFRRLCAVARVGFAQMRPSLRYWLGFPSDQAIV